jgi:hypothetical protein
VRHVLVLAALALTSCGGGSPSAPSVIAPAVVLPVTLNSGAYTLAITLSRSGQPVCTGNFCTTISLCFGNPDTTPAQFDVHVDRMGDDAKITVDGGQSLAILLHTASVPASGDISGSGRDARGNTMRVAGTLSGTGSSSPGVAASGNIDGQVDTANGGCSNNGHTWTLSRN